MFPAIKKPVSPTPGAKASLLSGLGRVHDQTFFGDFLGAAFAGVGHVPATHAQTADSILANKKQRNAPLLPPTIVRARRPPRPSTQRCNCLTYKGRARRSSEPSSQRCNCMCAPAMQRPSPNEV